MHIYSFDKNGRFVVEPEEMEFQKSLIYKLYSDKFFAVFPERMFYIPTNLFFGKDISNNFYYSFRISFDLWQEGVRVFPGLLKVEPNKNVIMPITKSYTSKVFQTDIFNSQTTQVQRNSFLGHLVLNVN